MASWGACRPPNPPASLEGPKASPDPPPGEQGFPDPPCAQARMVRTAKEHEVIMARSMMSNHTPTYKTKYCGHSNVIHPIQSQYKKVSAVGRHHKRGAAASCRGTSFVVSFVLALSGVNVVAVTTIRVLHFGVIGSQGVWGTV